MSTHVLMIGRTEKSEESESEKWLKNRVEIIIDIFLAASVMRASLRSTHFGQMINLLL